MTLQKVGYVVLYHLDPKYKHAQHCFDFAPDDIGDRVKQHYAGKSQGPALVRAAVAAGSKLQVVRHWSGTREDLTRYRRGQNAGKYCKVCRQIKRMKYQDEHMEELLAESIWRKKHGNER